MCVRLKGDADDLAAAQAILRGLKKRHEKLGDHPAYIHTVSFSDLDTATSAHPGALLAVWNW